MAVGKGSMERAAKTAGTSEASAKKTQTAKAPAKKAAKTAAKTKRVAAETIAAPTEEVMEKIVYQKNNGMLERDAEPNEVFGLGDAMPVYYF